MKNFWGSRETGAREWKPYSLVQELRCTYQRRTYYQMETMLARCHSCHQWFIWVPAGAEPTFDGCSLSL